MVANKLLDRDDEDKRPFARFRRVLRALPRRNARQKNVRVLRLSLRENRNQRRANHHTTNKNEAKLSIKIDRTERRPHRPFRFQPHRLVQSLARRVRRLRNRAVAVRVHLLRLRRSRLERYSVQETPR